MPRPISGKDLAYDQISAQWETFICSYDTQRRVEVLIDDFLGEKKIKGKTCLDGGCGLGYFSQAALKHHPQRVVSIDISPRLVERMCRQEPEIEAAVADLLALDSTISDLFDIVISSDVVEHTPDPETAVKQLARRLNPGGYISISVPNRRWIWLLNVAQFLGIRQKYLGYENWVRPRDLIIWLQEEDVEILRAQGVHTFPWQFLPKRVLRKIDQTFRNLNYSISLNLAVLGKKRAANMVLSRKHETGPVNE